MFANLHIPLLLLTATLTLPTYATVVREDFNGTGHIYVWQSDDWRTATPDSTVGCLDAYGKLVAIDGSRGCGVFERAEDYPHALSTDKGNCTFHDATQEENLDNLYGKGDYAWNCVEHESDSNDVLFTVVRSLICPLPTIIANLRLDGLSIHLPLLGRRVMLLRRQAHTSR
jgi:hypothetical protein